MESLNFVHCLRLLPYLLSLFVDIMLVAAAPQHFQLTVVFRKLAQELAASDKVIVARSVCCPGAGFQF